MQRAAGLDAGQDSHGENLTGNGEIWKTKKRSPGADERLIEIAIFLEPESDA
jgi:hypothetical protein